MAGWHRIRTRKRGDRQVRKSDIWIALAVGLLWPLAPGLVLLHWAGVEGARMVVEIAGFFLMIGIFAVLVMPVGALLGLRALRAGLGDWLVGLAAGFCGESDFRTVAQNPKGVSKAL